MQETFYHVAGCPLRIALVSDFHERPLAALTVSLRAQRPDVICITGDFVFGRIAREKIKVREAGLILPFFAACAEIAPCFVSLGNHEWLLTDEDFEAIRETGVRLLDNDYCTREINGVRTVFGGLTSSYVTGHRRRWGRSGFAPGEMKLESPSVYIRRPPELAWLDAFCAQPGYHILLCHHPEYYPRYLRERGIELVLSGHAHGGQVRIFGRGLFAPGQGILPKLTSGVEEGRLVISRGLANCQRVPRLFNPPELVYILPQAARSASGEAASDGAI